MPLTHFRSLPLNHSKTSSLHKTSRASLVLKPAVTPPPSEKEVISRYSSYYRDSDAIDISSIPVELLQEIFLLMFNSALVAARPRGPPVSLSQTCRLWRDLAINIPSLWNVVPVVPEIPPYLLQQWIARSQPLPLVLHVQTSYFACERNPKTRHHDATILDILDSYAARWEELHLCIHSPHDYGRLLVRPPAAYNSLKRVHWAAPIDDPSGGFERFWGLASGIPTLQDVRLVRIPWQGPWTQLTKLQLRNPDFESVLRLLPQCNSLAVLHMYSVRMPPPVASVIPSPPIALSKLTDLHLYLDHHQDILLDCLNLPSVRRMCYGIETRGALDSIGNMLHRSAAHLEALQLSGIHEQNLARTIPFLRQSCFHQLGELILGMITPESTLWEAMKDPTFLPALHSLCWTLPQYGGRSLIRGALEERVISGIFRRVTLLAHCWCRRSANCECDRIHEALCSQISDLIDVRTLKAGEHFKAEIIRV